MKYLKLRRSQLILAAFAVFALIVVVFPGIDLAISRYFFTGGSFARDVWWQQFLHDSLNWFLGVSLGSIVLLFVFNRLTGRKLAGIDGRKVVFLFLVLIVGAGLIVNVGLKGNIGRARPRDVVEFGGTHKFTRAFVVSHECARNCSFSSGDAAGGFFSIALVMVLTRRRHWIAAAMAAGIVFSIGRVTSGAHFFSDTVTSFFVMLIVSDVLYFYLIKAAALRAAAALLDTSAVTGALPDPPVKLAAPP